MTGGWRSLSASEGGALLENITEVEERGVTKVTSDVISMMSSVREDKIKCYHMKMTDTCVRVCSVCVSPVQVRSVLTLQSLSSLSAVRCEAKNSAGRRARDLRIVSNCMC